MKFLATTLLVATALAKNHGSISIEMDGTKKTVYVVSGDWGNISVHDNGFTMKGGSRVYFSEKETDNFDDPNMFWQADLMGKHFSYEVDLSNVDCHLNAASYFIGMPAYNSGMQPTKGSSGDWYCDANNGNGSWCPEYDLFESNKYTMATTLHTCDYQPPKFYSHCDGGGC